MNVVTRETLLSCVSFKQINYLWYVECVKLHLVARQLNPWRSRLSHTFPH
jgi:hypothetical protein